MSIITPGRPIMPTPCDGENSYIAGQVVRVSFYAYADPGRTIPQDPNPLPVLRYEDDQQVVHKVNPGDAGYLHPDVGAFAYDIITDGSDTADWVYQWNATDTGRTLDFGTFHVEQAPIPLT